jgi:hypothetical protein
LNTFFAVLVLLALINFPLRAHAEISVASFGASESDLSAAISDADWSQPIKIEIVSYGGAGADNGGNGGGGGGYAAINELSISGDPADWSLVFNSGDDGYVSLERDGHSMLRVNNGGSDGKAGELGSGELTADASNPGGTGGNAGSGTGGGGGGAATVDGAGENGADGGSKGGNGGANGSGSVSGGEGSSDAGTDGGEGSLAEGEHLGGGGGSGGGDGTNGGNGGRYGGGGGGGSTGGTGGDGVVVIRYTLATVPVVATREVTDINQTSVTAVGHIVGLGASTPTLRGVVYGLDRTKLNTDQGEKGSFSAGDFDVKVTGLACNTTYYLAAYASNDSGTGHGDTVHFTTRNCTPKTSSLPVVFSKASGSSLGSMSLTPFFQPLLIPKEPLPSQSGVTSPVSEEGRDLPPAPLLLLAPIAPVLSITPGAQQVISHVSSEVQSIASEVVSILTQEISRWQGYKLQGAGPFWNLIHAWGWR